MTLTRLIILHFSLITIKCLFVGVDIGELFDDEVESMSPVKIATLTTRYSNLIDGIVTTYVLCNGMKGHGVLNSTTPVSLVRSKQNNYDKDNAKAIISENAVIHFSC